MSRIIEVRRSILKNIETLAQECADVMHYLKVKMIYEYLSEKMGEDCPALSELESILDDLSLRLKMTLEKTARATTGRDTNERNTRIARQSERYVV